MPRSTSSCSTTASESDFKDVIKIKLEPETDLFPPTCSTPLLIDNVNIKREDDSQTVVLVSDSEEEEEKYEPVRKLRKGNKSAFYGKFFEATEDDKEEERKLAEAKKSKTHDVESMHSLIRLLKRKKENRPNYVFLSIKDFECSLLDFTNLFKYSGLYIKTLSLQTVDLFLIKQISRNCIVLEELIIRESNYQDDSYEISLDLPTADINTIASSQINFHKSFKHLHLMSNDFFLGQNQQNLKLLLEGVGDSIITFEYTFRALPEVDLVIETMKSINFRKLANFALIFSKNVSGDEVLLRRKQFQDLSHVNINFETIELICGLWEDITPAQIQYFLSKHDKNLVNFNIAGSFQGVDLMHNTIRINIPKMDKLKSFRMGAIYEFEEEDCSIVDVIGDEEERSLTPPQDQIITLDDKGFVSITVDFAYKMISLEELVLGNSVKIEKILPWTFPKLHAMKIGSYWSTSLDIPGPSDDYTKFPQFITVTELQLPDFFKDLYFVKQVCRIFPNLRKVWLNLPNAKLLREFIGTMRGSSLIELHIKTQYDFRGILEYALLDNRPSAVEAFKKQELKEKNRREKTKNNLKNKDENIVHQDSESPGPSRECYQHGLGPEYELLMKLKNPEDDDRVFRKFIQFHNIELPVLSRDEESYSIGISGISGLQVLNLHHIPRKLKIPLNNELDHNDFRQSYHPKLRIGFSDYPLVDKFFKWDIQKLKDLSSLNYQNILAGCEYKMPNLVEYTGKTSSKSDRKIRKINPTHGETIIISDDETEMKKSHKLKLKIRPADATREQFKIKPEKIETKPGIVT